MIRTVYYKISHEWAVKAGLAEAAPQHPDGMHLVLPSDGHRIAVILERETGNPRLLPLEALAAIGAIPLTSAEAHASARGENLKASENAPAEASEEDQSVSNNQI